jgi:hypothetical protein
VVQAGADVAGGVVNAVKDGVETVGKTISKAMPWNW